MRLPSVPRGPRLGVGFDLPFGSPNGFERGPDGRDRLCAPIERFMRRDGAGFASVFVSWQPCDRAALDPARYFDALDSAFASAPAASVRALHHTALNLGALEAYDHAAVARFTNALVARYDLRWVNEDLGVWSLRGRPLAYPLPPYLTEAGLAASVRNARVVQQNLDCPLQVEFPGFSEGTSFVIGRLHAYDFFRRMADEADVCVALDTGHLLSYQWLLGRRAEALYDDLERLPLDRCTEIHLSGSELVEGRFYDRHHGVLLSEQITLLRRLIPRCPELRLVTWEDPKPDADGALPPEQRESLDAVRAAVAEAAR